MPPNSIAKTSLIVGGLTFLGFMAGGRLGSMFGAVIGTVVCSMLNTEEPIRIQEPRAEISRVTPYDRPNNKNRKHKANKSKNEVYEPSKCSICLEPFKPSIVLMPCSHMCFCDECFENAKNKNVSTCPICRNNIENIMYVYPS
ncbi:mitochondrial ubiquitin ligase activator of NFKB 1-like [Melanaphis sacchari]|uniref:RING finger protein B n=1 Tax=Melanaphis sacchari TaxID=742174 RepID=A0A2H8TEM7_9HEMI|nr:mitochondrial ubiquitin ligase activator of NFKB 1-like [Melanaphis sacchari]XP_025201605.1 mitochondrial ubiquitin ligase activator of NFKB 1-like [Melanaphis sacchari]